MKTNKKNNNYVPFMYLNPCTTVPFYYKKPLTDIFKAMMTISAASQKAL